MERGNVMNAQMSERVVRGPRAGDLHELEAKVRRRVKGRLWNLRLALRGNGLVLEGSAPCYYAKQLAQHAVMEATDCPILLNAIEVR
jgi:hypothetical protein